MICWPWANTYGGCIRVPFDCGRWIASVSPYWPNAFILTPVFVKFIVCNTIWTCIKQYWPWNWSLGRTVCRTLRHSSKLPNEIRLPDRMPGWSLPKASATVKAREKVVLIWCELTNTIKFKYIDDRIVLPNALWPIFISWNFSIANGSTTFQTPKTPHT